MALQADDNSDSGQGLGSFDWYPVEETHSDEMATNTGDGLGEYSDRREAGAGAGETDYSALVGQFHTQMGDGKSMRQDQRLRVLNKIYNLAGATSAADKKLVEQALTFLFIVHGASANVDWSGVEMIAGGGTRKVNMSKVVREIDRKYLRKFAIGFSDEAFKMHDNSAELRELLKERAVRVGMPITETRSMIDFARMDDENPYQAGLRVKAKYGAVARAERQSNTHNSLNKASHVATKIDYVDTPRAGDDLGPLE